MRLAYLAAWLYVFHGRGRAVDGRPTTRPFPGPLPGKHSTRSGRLACGAVGGSFAEEFLLSPETSTYCNSPSCIEARITRHVGSKHICSDHRVTHSMFWLWNACFSSLPNCVITRSDLPVCW